MFKTVRIGDTVYRLAKNADGARILEAIDVPEGEDAPEADIDGDELLASLGDKNWDDLVTARTEAHATWTEARKAIQDGSTDVAPLQDAALRFLVIDTHVSEVAEARDAADIGEVEAVVMPNPPTPVPDPPADKPDKSKKGKDTETEDPPAEDTDTEAAIEPDEVIEVEEVELDEAELNKMAELVAARLSPVAADGRPMPMFLKDSGPFTRQQLRDGAHDAPAPAGPTVREPAPLVASAGATTLRPSEIIATDDDFLGVLQEWESAHRDVEKQERTVLAHYQLFPDDEGLPPLDSQAPNSFAAVRANGRDLNFPHRPHIHADGSTCDTCVREQDFRRGIPDASFGIPSMEDLFEVYPSQHCNLEYYRALSLSAIDAGITNWDAARQAAYCAARDAYYAALRAGAPVDPQLYVDMKALEKDCAIPSCVPTDKVQPEGMAACLRYSLEMQHCNPEIIPVYREALMRWYTLRKNMRIMQMMDRYAIPLNVDSRATPFVNVAGDPLGASVVVCEVIEQLLAAGQMAEFIQEGNYTILAQFGFNQFLDSDQKKRAHGEMQSFASMVGLPMITTFTEVPVAPVPALAGESNPGPVGTLAEQQAALGGTWSFGPGSLPPNVQNGGPTGVGGYTGDGNGATGNAGGPVAGEAAYWNDASGVWSSLQWPDTWTVRLVDMNDYFMVRRPSIRVGGQATPNTTEHDDLLGNMLFDLFVEDFFGVGKDGLSPSWTVHFGGLCNNGARVDAISPQGLC